MNLEFLVAKNHADLNIDKYCIQLITHLMNHSTLATNNMIFFVKLYSLGTDRNMWPTNLESTFWYNKHYEVSQ